jgi:hypothetical protein
VRDLRRLLVLAVILAAFFFLAGCINFNYGIPRPLETMRITGQKYAVLISGRTEERHVKAMELTYKILLKSGFSPKNIIVLDAKGSQSRPYPVNGPADSGSIRLCFRYLANKIGPTDLLFVYVGDHGHLDERYFSLDGGYKFSPGRVGKREVAEIGLSDGCMDEMDFAACVNKIHSRVGIFIFTECYGGYFARRLQGPGRITIAPTARGKCNSYAFTRAFFGALQDSCVDTDGNSKISIREAFRYSFWRSRSIQTFWRSPFMSYGLEREVYLSE